MTLARMAGGHCRPAGGQAESGSGNCSMRLGHALPTPACLAHPQCSARGPADGRGRAASCRRAILTGHSLVRRPHRSRKRCCCSRWSLAGPSTGGASGHSPLVAACPLAALPAEFCQPCLPPAFPVPPDTPSGDRAGRPPELPARPRSPRWRERAILNCGACGLIWRPASAKLRLYISPPSNTRLCSERVIGRINADG